MSEFLYKNKLAQYLLLSKEIKDAKAQQEILKLELEPHLQAAETNARGSHVIVFSDALNVGGTNYSGLQKVRKESKVLNEERVLDYLWDKINDPRNHPDAWRAAMTKVYHVDQDALWELFVKDMISQEELDSFFDVTESYAFLPTKE